MNVINKERFRQFISAYVGSFLTIFALSFVFKGINGAMIIVGPALLGFMFLLGLEVWTRKPKVKENDN